MSFVTPYKDSAAVNDRDDNPAERTGVCLRCGDPWLPHVGWRCTNARGGFSPTFIRTPVNVRFETQEMVDSLAFGGWISPYKDMCAGGDRVDWPADRDETCVNCGYGRVSHTGWRCRIAKAYQPARCYDQLPAEARYLTPSMMNAFSHAVFDPSTWQVEPTTIRMHTAPDLSDWRTWRSAGPNECTGCGAPLPCRYHS